MPEIGEIRKGGEIGYVSIYGKFIWDACPDCGKERWVPSHKGKPNTRRCRSCECRTRFGEKSGGWKGGRNKRPDGYIQVKLRPDNFFYPMAKKSGYVMEHRLVIAKALGRCLLPWETVHHKEGYARDDNRYPEVLELLPNPYKHDALTKMTNYIRRLENRIKELEERLR